MQKIHFSAAQELVFAFVSDVQVIERIDFTQFCSVPIPGGPTITDYLEQHIQEVFESVGRLGVKAVDIRRVNMDEVHWRPR